LTVKITVDSDLGSVTALSLRPDPRKPPIGV
jgi:hypothetical protein